MGEKLDSAARSGSGRASWRPPHPRWCGAARLALWALAALALGACGESQPKGPTDLLGHASAALTFNATKIKSIDYTITFTFLESDPPDTYSTQEYTSVVHNGQLITVLPCRTGPEGRGYNQADVTAVIHFQVQSLGPVTVHESAIFECVRNADTRVNILLDVAGQLDDGFTDLIIAAAGTLCSQKTDWKPDTFLGVCADSQCGDSNAVFLYPVTCDTISGADPIFWFCGSPNDWSVLGVSVGKAIATGYFAVPEIDGLWEFGVIALDPMRMADDDPTLTDELGELRVWTGIAWSHATLERQNGQNINGTPRLEGKRLDFVALLDVPPQQPGQPSPQVLLYGNNTDEGVSVAFQTRFGACDQAVQGTGLYDGFNVADVRLEGTSKVRLLLTDPSFTFVRTVAVCEAGWDAADRPTVTCGPPGPLF